MKKLFLTALCICLSTLFLSTNAMTEANKVTPEAIGKMIQHNTGLPASVVNMTTEEFLDLTPRKVKEMTGEKLSMKETIALKAAQKQIKKELADAEGAGEGSKKSQMVALLLVIFLGGLGIHRFYLGYTTYGIIQLLTAGGCGVWALIDLIRIITGDLKPADGSEYDPKL